MRFPYDTFTITSLEAWCALTQPLSIEMTDHQYFLFTGMVGKNLKDFKGIPIQFADAPKAA